MGYKVKFTTTIIVGDIAINEMLASVNFVNEDAAKKIISEALGRIILEDLLKEGNMKEECFKVSSKEV